MTALASLSIVVKDDPNASKEIAANLRRLLKKSFKVNAINTRTAELRKLSSTGLVVYS